MKKRGIEPITSQKANRARKPTQDGRSMRRYRKRWKIEGSNTRQANLRHFVVHYVRDPQIYKTFL